VINENLKTIMTEADVFAVVSKAQEFDQIKVKLKKKMNCRKYYIKYLTHRSVI